MADIARKWAFMKFMQKKSVGQEQGCFEQQRSIPILASLAWLEPAEHVASQQRAASKETFNAELVL